MNVSLLTVQHGLALGGGSGVTTLAGTANQITVSAATGAVTLSVPATFIAPGSIAATGFTASSILYSDVSKVITSVAMTGNSGKYLTTDGTVPSWATVTVPVGADPSASVGLSAVVGVATTFMRSDGAPALSVAITPTWTGTHIFSNATLTASFAKAQNGFTAAEVKNTTNSTTAAVYLDLLAGANELTLYTFSALYNQTTYMGIAAGGYNLLRAAGTTNGLMIETSGSTQPIIIGTNNVERLRIADAGISLSGGVIAYKGVTTAGWGVPAVYGAGVVTAQTARSAAIASYTVGAADGTFEVTGNVNVSVSTAHSFTLDVSYTDETNTAQTLILPMAQLAGAFVTGGLITNATGVGPYEAPTMCLRCKAATSITIRPSAGTFTTVTYSATAAIKQLA